MLRSLTFLSFIITLTGCAPTLSTTGYTDFAKTFGRAHYCMEQGVITNTAYVEFATEMYRRLDTYSCDKEKVLKLSRDQIEYVSKRVDKEQICQQMSQLIEQTNIATRVSNSSTGNMMATNRLMLLNLAQQQPPQYNYEPMNLPTPNYNTGGNSEYYTIRGPNGTQRCTTTPSGIIHCF